MGSPLIDFGASQVPQGQPQSVDQSAQYIGQNGLAPAYQPGSNVDSSFSAPSSPTKTGLRAALAQVFGNFMSGAGQAAQHEAGIDDSNLQRAQTANLNANTALVQQQAKPILLTDPATSKPMYDPNGQLMMGSLAQQKEINDTFKQTGGTVPVPAALAQAYGYPELAGHPIAAKYLTELIKSQNKPETLEQMIGDSAQRAISKGIDPNQDPTTQQLLHVRNTLQSKPPSSNDRDEQYISLVQKKLLQGPQSLTLAENAFMGAYEKVKTMVPTAKFNLESTQKDDARADRSYQYNSGELDKASKPIDDSVARFGRLQDTISQKTPAADSLIAPELLSVMAGGQGSGVRVNEAEITRVLNGRSNEESIKAALNKWQLDPSKALSVTDAQRQQIASLLGTVHDKLLAKQSAIEQGRQALINTDDVAKHRQIVADVRQKLNQIDAGQQQSVNGIQIIRDANGKITDVR